MNVALPLTAGGLIYLLWRDDGLLMFSWIRWIGWYESLHTIRTSFADVQSSIPEWILYSLPDGLWVYSMTSFFGFIWRNSSRVTYAFWVSLGPAMGIGSEIGQLFGVPGVFCLNDLTSYILATTISIHTVNGQH